jgi:hypothetical protein
LNFITFDKLAQEAHKLINFLPELYYELVATIINDLLNKTIIKNYC